MLPDPYLGVYVVLSPFRDARVCREQRLNLEYALAMAFAGDNCVHQALDCLSTAWNIAERLRDWGAQSEIGYLAAALCHLASDFSGAYTRYQEAITALRRLERDNGPADPTFELDLVLGLAWCASELGNVATALHHMDEGYSLRADWAPAAAEQAASLSWLDSYMSRRRGQPSRALQQATAAAYMLMEHGRPINVGRAHINVAESALDLFEITYTPEGQGKIWTPQSEDPSKVRISPASLLKQAHTAADYALEIANQAQDRIGATLARLSLRRATRLSRRVVRDNSGIFAADKLLRTARRLGDPSLLGRAQITLADELLEAGNREEALATYRRALLILEEHHLGALAFWPRQVLQHQ
jgi:tetratricopeptide (TPR) repeat protein